MTTAPPRPSPAKTSNRPDAMPGGDRLAAFLLGARRHARSPYGLALLALTAVLVFAAYQVRLGHTVHVGVLRDDRPYVAGMHDPEQAGPTGGRYRWTTDRAEIRLPGLGRGPYRLTLHLAGSANPQPRVEVLVNGAPEGSLELTSGFADYTLDLPATVTASGDVLVELRPSTFQPPGDRRALGVVIDRVEVRPAGDVGLLLPPATQAWRLLALVALCYLLAAIAGFGPRAAALGGAAFALGLTGLLLVNRPWLTVWTGGLLVAALAGVALALLLRAALPPLYRLAGLRLGPGELRWPVLLAAVFFVIHLGGNLHPHTIIVDIGFHINRYNAVHEGGQWVIMVQSREWGTRDTVYPPVAYYVMRPLRWLAPDVRHTIILFIALAEATRLCLVYLVARKATASAERGARNAERGIGTGRTAQTLSEPPASSALRAPRSAFPAAGPLAALVFGIVPMAYLPFSWGIATNVFGAWCTTALFAILALGYDSLRRPVLAALAAVAATLALLSHPGEFVLAAATLGGAVLLFGVAWRPRFRGGWPVLALVAVLAGGLAFALLYRHVAGQMLTQGAQTVQTKLGGAATPGAGSAPASWRVGGAIDDPIIGLQGYRVTTVPELIAGGLVGYWREAVGYYYLWPPVFALAALGLMRGTRDLERLRLASALWWAVAALFALAGLLLNVYVRYAYYLLPVIAIGAGLSLSRLTRLGRWGQMAVAVLLVVTTTAGLWFWYLRISVDGH